MENLKHSISDSDKYVMVIDDDVDDRTIFCTMLRSVNKDIICVKAKDGREALEFLEKEGVKLPDFIFLDINMPVMTGWEFLATIKRHDKLKHVPVIMFSTSSNPRDVEIAYDLGAMTYCVKPDEPTELKKMLGFVNNMLYAGIKNFIHNNDAGKYFVLPSK
jgi:CheY-like chemotaxis protein